MSDEKRFPPSAKKLEKARKDGQVVKSQLLGQAVVFIGVFCGLVLSLHLPLVSNQTLLQCANAFCVLWPAMYLEVIGKYVASMVVTALLCGATASIMLTVVRQGVNVSFKPILSYMPFQGGGYFKRVGNNVKPTVAKLLLLVTLGGVFLWFFLLELPSFAALLGAGEQLTLSAGLKTILFRTLTVAALGLLVVGICEYCLERRRFLNNLRMSRQELVDEQRESEGDPVIKGERRSLHRELSLSDIKERVRHAKVVVVAR